MASAPVRTPSPAEAIEPQAVPRRASPGSAAASAPVARASGADLAVL